MEERLFHSELFLRVVGCAVPWVWRQASAPYESPLPKSRQEGLCYRQVGGTSSGELMGLGTT